MNLKEFITTTLIEIAEGIKDAQPKYSELNAAINPCHMQRDNTNGLYFKKQGGHTDDMFTLSSIDFEIGLTDNSSSEGKAGVGVAFATLGIGGSTKEQTGSVSVTKVKFNVPVRLPAQSL